METLFAVTGPDISWLPSLGSSAAAVVVVWFFLSHLSSERKVRATEMAERDERITKCIDRNSEAIDKNTEVLGNTLEVLRRYNGAS